MTTDTKLHDLIEVHRGWCNYCQGQVLVCNAAPSGGCALRDYLRSLAAAPTNAAPDQPSDTPSDELVDQLSLIAWAVPIAGKAADRIEELETDLAEARTLLRWR